MYQEFSKITSALPGAQAQEAREITLKGSSGPPGDSRATSLSSGLERLASKGYAKNEGK